MARIPFSKWQGTGNDFVVIDDRATHLSEMDTATIARLCDRRFGVGSDGLILLRPPIGVGMSYHMEFFNPDGSRSFCGNGSRCAFAHFRGLVPVTEGKQLRFTAVDGEHSAAWTGDLVTIGMRDVAGVEGLSKDMDFIHTGSPHLICWVEDPEAVDLVPVARAHRYGPRFGAEGVNVNFVSWQGGRLHMRTYERGVENETLSCGTGVTAAALSAMHRGLCTDVCEVRTRGGELRVRATAQGAGFTGVELAGPVGHVFDGIYELAP